MNDELHGNRKPGPLNLDIYAAVLGGWPRIAPREEIAATPSSPRRAASSGRRARVALPVEPGVDGPLLDAEFRDRLGRCVAQAARVLADVRSRVVGVFQESTIGRRDRKPLPRIDVAIGEAAERVSRSKHAA